MEKKAFFRIMLALMLAGILATTQVEVVGAQYTVHFTCETMNRGSGGSITFASVTYVDGQSAAYSQGDYWITGNPPSPTGDWRFYRWQVLWLGSQSWVDNEYSQTTLFHLRGEVYLNAEFYAPIQTNSPLYPTLYYGEKQRITGSARQYYSQQLGVYYYPHGSGWGPPRSDGYPPFGCSVAGYQWTTVTVGSYPGTWDTGLITPLIPRFSPSYNLPMVVDVFTGWHVGDVEEVDSNVVSFTIEKAPVLINAPSLTPSAISLGQSVLITGQIFSQYYIDANDMTGTWKIEAQDQGGTTWTEIASSSFTSVHGYSSVYGAIGVFHDISYSWEPEQAGTFNIRISYDGNRYYSSKSSLYSVLSIGNVVDLGVVPQVQHKDTQMLCLRGCSLTGDHLWDNEHPTRACDHDDMYCVPASISMINSYFGGHLSQDRIMYYIMRELDGSLLPENQLGHGRGVFPGETGDALSWALNDASIDHSFFKPSFPQITGWIDSGRPILRRDILIGVWHATIIDGYEATGQLVHVVNPWTGTESSLAYNTLDVTEVWVPPSSATARSDEFELSLDSDSDGVVDFDEINRFNTNPNNPDSDGDLVFDKQEVISYTFLHDGTYDIADERRPDPENWGFGDGMRAELDIDSDNGGTTDGLEDLNRNGRVDPGETDPLDSSDDRLQAASVRVTAHSPVNLLVTDPDNRRVGYDPETESVVNEIPGATYSGPGSEPQEITIPNSINGTYQVEAIGTAIGPYTITVESLDSNGSAIDEDSWQGTAVPDERYIENMSLETDGRLVLPHDVEISDIRYSRTIVAKGQSVFIFVTVENQGNYTETFSVDTFVNMTIIDTTEVTLASGESTLLIVAWGTTDADYAIYIPSANATIVADEKDTVDNTRAGTTIIVTIEGDVNGDGAVDSSDLSTLNTAYGSQPSVQDWNPNCDLNYDNKTDVKDLYRMGTNYGQTIDSMDTFDKSLSLLPLAYLVLCLASIDTSLQEKKRSCERKLSSRRSSFSPKNLDIFRVAEHMTMP